MARLPRLCVPGLPHLLVHRSADGRAVLCDTSDFDAYQACLRDACSRHALAMHAFALSRAEVWLLATPTDASGLGAAMQTVGRTFVRGFNRRHGRFGPLWEGRFRSAVIEAGTYFVDCLRYVDTVPVRAGLVEQAQEWPWSSASHHLGQRRVAGVSDHPQWLTLGNTPFAREAAYLALLGQPFPPELAEGIERAARLGWPLASEAFVERLAGEVARRVSPLRRGRRAKDS